MVLGYDNKVKIKNTNLKGPETTGALLIRNSWGSTNYPLTLADVIGLSRKGGVLPLFWGTEWGEKGYGWLPYEYLLAGLADEWWSLIKSQWIDSGEFGL